MWMPVVCPTWTNSLAEWEAEDEAEWRARPQRTIRRAIIARPGRPDLPRHRWTVDDYHRMAAVGLLDADARVELIEGEIVEMASVGDPHIDVSIRLTRLLVLAVGERGVVSVSNPIRLNAHNESQPDFAVLRPRADYRTRGPTPGRRHARGGNATRRCGATVGSSVRSMPAPGLRSTGS